VHVCVCVCVCVRACVYRRVLKYMTYLNKHKQRTYLMLARNSYPSSSNRIRRYSERVSVCEKERERERERGGVRVCV
jgi:hypothetical protein